MVARQVLTSELLRPSIKVFISYAYEDSTRAEKLYAALDESGFKVWGFGKDFSLGAELKPKVREEIEECDFFILVLSEHSAQSNWVQMELGLANSLHNSRSDFNPRIFGFGVQTGDSNATYSMRDFDTEKLISDTFAFNQITNADESLYDINALIAWMTPKVRFVGREIQDTNELYETEAFFTYRKLFPNEEERDPEKKICDWISEEIATETKGPESSILRFLRRVPGLRGVHQPEWGSVCAVLQVGGISIGFAYLTVHLTTGWIFGNYFCLLACWRPHGRAQKFIDAIEGYIRQNYVNAKAIVFEVEILDETKLMTILSKLEEGTVDFSKDEWEQIRSVARIGLYQSKRAYVAINSSSRGYVTYRQPAMRLPVEGEVKDGAEFQNWLSDNEWPFWLMIRPVGLSASTSSPRYRLKHILDFLYIELFGKSYDKVLVRKGFSYLEYVRTLQKEILSKNDKFIEGSNGLPTVANEVWSAVRRRRLRFNI